MKINYKGEKCETCSNQATSFLYDVIEVEPRNGWAHYVTGDIHYGCNNHKPPNNNWRIITDTLLSTG